MESSAEISLEVLEKFRLIFGSVRNHFRKIEESCGISGSQLWILKEINLSPGIGVTKLSEKLSIHQTTCSLLVEKLVSKRLVSKKRSEEDQRRVGLHVLENAQAVLAKAPGPAEGILPSALSKLSSESLKELKISLDEVIRNLDHKDNELSHAPLADL